MSILIASCSAHVPLLQEALRGRGLEQSRLGTNSPSPREGGVLQLLFMAEDLQFSEDTGQLRAQAVPS